MTRRAFTLIEMLLATVLASILMAAVLFALSAIARDRAMMQSADKPTAGSAADLIAWDLRGARFYATSVDPDTPLELIGNNGIASNTLRPDGRLVRVSYRVNGSSLWRQQEYLDDPARPTPWQGQVTSGFESLAVQPSPGDMSMAVPARMQFDLLTTFDQQRRQVSR